MPGCERRLAAGECIHTENSYMWTLAGFAELLREAGFWKPRPWNDERGWCGAVTDAA